MRKIATISVFVLTLVVSFLYVSYISIVRADWWDRPTTRPTQPSIPRDVTESPTSVPTQPDPTTTPRIGEPTVAPTGDQVQNPSPTPVNSISTAGDEDPCASGKSFTGPYCGWSPRVEEGNGSGSLSTSSYSPRIGGPKVKGLSYTSGSSLTISDIMLLFGILCLLLYVKSKATVGKGRTH